MRTIQEARSELKAMRGWSDNQIVEELRNPVRATISPEAGYHLLIAEALARLLDNSHLKR